MPGSRAGRRAGRTPCRVSSTGSPPTVTSRASRQEHDVAELEPVGRRRRLGAPQHGLDPRRELARRERLRHVVVGAHLEAGDAVGLLVARGQHHDRHAPSGRGCRGRRRSRPCRAGRCRARRGAVASRSRLRERVLAGAHPGDAVARLLQVGAHERADRLLVLDEQELRPGRGCRRRTRRAGPGSSLPARTSKAGASPSRTTTATIPRRSDWKPVAAAVDEDGGVGGHGDRRERPVALAQRKRAGCLGPDRAPVDAVVVEARRRP